MAVPMLKMVEKQPATRSTRRANSGALELVLRLRDEPMDMYVNRIAQLSGDDVATVILRAIGLGLAGNARSELNERLWCTGLPGTASAVSRRTFRVVLAPQWAVVAERTAAILSDDAESPLTAGDQVEDALTCGMDDLWRHWTGAFGEGTRTADVIEESRS
jgi:hypothetical protein